MMSSAATTTSDTTGAPAFRLDNERLAFRFTATLSDRYGTPIERLPAPGRLDDWLAANDLTVGDEHTTAGDLELAHRLREAIHQAGTGIARGGAPDAADREVINRLLREEQLCPELTEEGLRWFPGMGRQVRGALSLIAHDAVTVLGGPERRQVKTCSNPDCAGLYVDTSQAQNRRWCSMNVCGNRAKKAKYRGTRKTSSSPA